MVEKSQGQPPGMQKISINYQPQPVILQDFLNHPEVQQFALQNDGWKTILFLFERPIFQGELLNFQGISTPLPLTNQH